MRSPREASGHVCENWAIMIARLTKAIANNTGVKSIPCHEPAVEVIRRIP